MKTPKLIFLIALLILPFFGLFAQGSFIHVDQFGYYNQAQKVAVLSDPMEGFNAGDSYAPSTTLEVRRAGSNEVVFSGSPSQWNNGEIDDYSGDRGWWFDFSSIEVSGSYFIHDPVNNISSPIFVINENPYIEVLKSSVKMFYYNRCNMAKEAPFAAPNWVDGNNFNNDLQDFNCRYIYDAGNVSLEKNLSGGWFDAGDYNKYVSFTRTVIHDLLYAYEKHPMLFGDDWDLPESGNDLPDILDEIKWELDWLAKMTNPDGSVHNKMGSQNYGENISSPPSINTDQRFYGPTCTSASATIASTFAHAGNVFSNIPSYENYGAYLIGIATTCFEYTKGHLDANTLELDCDDGSIVAGDADLNEEEQLGLLISAAVHLFEATGEQQYNDFLTARAFTIEPLSNLFWSAYRMTIQDAVMHYTTIPNADIFLASDFENSFHMAVNNNWNDFYYMNDLTLYRDFMPDWSYHWGSNRSKAGFGNLNLLAAQHEVVNEVEGLKEKAEELLHAFHGVNPLGIVYLSNMYDLGAEKSVNEIYHNWFNDGTEYDNAITSLKGPAPGFLVGGPNRHFSVSTISPPFDQPDSKSYLDFNAGWPDNSWEVSEPSITYQASYVRLLADIIGQNGYPTLTDVSQPKTQVYSLSIFPNPSKEYFSIVLPLGENKRDLTVSIFQLDGKLVKSISNVVAGAKISTAGLSAGTYLLETKVEGKVFSGKLIIE